ncbi:hypothetical protein M5D96_003079 [Drosophila gunungcola]|uniref:Uncharacterized protein n=1 Tax=Drosophila gunungcola TaxID=103775 RepID=A0A9P9Z157_9MUSC|nr:hypothetical protein M5D96_003079 [Drosophila gunungcola]
MDNGQEYVHSVTQQPASLPRSQFCRSHRPPPTQASASDFCDGIGDDRLRFRFQIRFGRSVRFGESSVCEALRKPRTERTENSRGEAPKTRVFQICKYSE